jgi:endonuclease YncB( thermonuclease family)
VRTTRLRRLAALIPPSDPHPAVVRSVHDGDTFRADIRLGAATLGSSPCLPDGRIRIGTVKIGRSVAVAVDLVVLAGVLGLELFLVDERIRLLGCHAAELATPAGAAAAANLAGILTPDRRITLDLVDDYKYGGELVADITLDDGTNLVAELVATGWAAPWNGTGKPPTPPWPRT